MHVESTVFLADQNEWLLLVLDLRRLPVCGCLCFCGLESLISLEHFFVRELAPSLVARDKLRRQRYLSECWRAVTSLEKKLAGVKASSYRTTRSVGQVFAVSNEGEVIVKE